MKTSTINFLVSGIAWIVAGVFAAVTALIHVPGDLNFFEAWTACTAGIAFIIAILGVFRGICLLERAS